MRTVAILGVSGVGKTTLLNSLRRNLSFRHLEASQLLKEEYANRHQTVPTSEDLRQGPVLNNQDMLIQGFERATRGYNGLVIFDGHVLIDGRDEIVDIPEEVFRALNVERFVFLQALPSTIADRRKADPSRIRPTRSPSEIQAHQTRALVLLAKYALSMGVPLLVMCADQIGSLLNFMQTDTHGSGRHRSNNKVEI